MGRLNLSANQHDSPDKVLQTLRDMQHELEGGAASAETLDGVRAAVNYTQHGHKLSF
jgi:hypothetical protein